MNLERLYLDYNATSPLSTSVTDWLKSGDFLFANPSSQHSLGKASRKQINESRGAIYKAFNLNEKTHKLFFHSGATEALLTFTYSFSEIARSQEKKLLICYAKTDHPAVSTLASRNWGDHVVFQELKLNSDLSYDHSFNLSLLKEEKEKNPDLMILYHHLWVHNETGLVSPLRGLAPFKTIDGLYLHIDCVQAPGKIPDWSELSEGDIWSFSAHKFGAFKGIGFSFFKNVVPFSPLVSGGGQQQALRSGTENPMGVKSIELALNDLKAVKVEETSKKKEELKSFIESELQGIGGTLTSPLENSNTIYFYFNKLSSDISLALFDLNGLMISAGSACSSGAAKESEILLAAGKKDVAKNGLRLSLPFEISPELITQIQTKFSLVIERIRKSV